MFLKKNSKVPLDKFINRVLYDKTKGYYMNKNPIGNKGDFITSPNISIMFSEMIAVWLISFWEKIGCPKILNIIELGAGNGEMMFQILKTTEKFNKFKSSSNFIIYEKSPHLKKIQKSKIKFSNIRWINNLKKINNYPSIFIANEFFDALPIKQFIKKKSSWSERYIKNNNENLEFYEKKTKKEFIERLIKQRINKSQNFIEYSPLANKKLTIISKIIKKNNGGLLVIDYGYNDKKMFDTLQSVKKHKKNSVLKNIYNADITHLINFYFLKKKISALKLDSVNLTTQREFLIKIGILERAEIISKNMPFSKKSDIYFRLDRLIGKKQMGDLFKVLFATKKINKFNLGF